MTAREHDLDPAMSVDAPDQCAPYRPAQAASGSPVAHLLREYACYLLPAAIAAIAGARGNWVAGLLLGPLVALLPTLWAWGRGIALDLPARAMPVRTPAGRCHICHSATAATRRVWPWTLRPVRVCVDHEGCGTPSRPTGRDPWLS